MIPKIICSECKGELSAGDKFCSVCGAEIDWKSLGPPDQTERSEEPSEPLPASSRRCPLCGRENLPEYRFCENCGAALGGMKEPSVGKTARSQEQQKRQKQKSAKRQQRRSLEKPGRIGLLPLQPWKLFSIPVVVIILGLAIYGVTSRNEEEHTHVPAAGTSLLQEIEYLQTIVEANPQDSPSLLRLANLLQDARFLPRAIEYYKQYLALVPMDANARVDMGICYFESGDARTAISEMEKALEFEPLHQLGHLNLGIVNLNSGNLEKANEWFTKCIEINPNTEAGKRAQRLLEQHASVQEPIGR